MESGIQIVESRIQDYLTWSDQSFFIFPFSFKDDEIQKQARLINQLKEQLSDQEESLKSSQVDTERLQSQINTMQSESETSKTEVKEVLQALEELAVNYDQKLQEVETKTKDNDKLSEELSQKQVQYTWLMDFFSFLFPSCHPKISA